MDNKEMNNQNQNAFNAAENPTPEAQSPVQPAQSDFEQSAPNPEQPAQTFDAQPQQASVELVGGAHSEVDVAQHTHLKGQQQKGAADAAQIGRAHV